jgi:hypothetical protein
MRQEMLRITIGILIIIVHSVCFVIIFMFKDDYLTRGQQLDMALLLMPVTAAYVTAVIRSAIENKSNVGYGPIVNANYAIIVILFTSLTLVGILYNVAELMGATAEDRRQIMVFEVVFGTGFGLIVADLFGKSHQRSGRPKPGAQKAG